MPELGAAGATRTPRVRGRRGPAWGGGHGAGESQERLVESPGSASPGLRKGSEGQSAPAARGRAPTLPLVIGNLPVRHCAEGRELRGLGSLSQSLPRRARLRRGVQIAVAAVSLALHHKMRGVMTALIVTFLPTGKFSLLPGNRPEERTLEGNVACT